MSYCYNCGAEIDGSMTFCPSCGARLDGTTSVSTRTATIEEPIYTVYLYSKGSATATELAELLMDLLGYSDNEAYEIIDTIPCAIACNLTLTQATYICQAFSEYGAEVTVSNNKGQSVNIDNNSTSESIFSDTGTLLAGAAAIFAGITLANRVTKIERWNRPRGWDYYFKPRYRRPRRPRHVRRKVHPAPAPRRATPTPRGGGQPRRASGGARSGGGRASAPKSSGGPSGRSRAGGGGGSRGGAGGGRGGAGGGRGGGPR